jgi:ABC-type molybdate transport system permease subunit
MQASHSSADMLLMHGWISNFNLVPVGLLLGKAFITVRRKGSRRGLMILLAPLVLRAMVLGLSILLAPVLRAMVLAVIVDDIKMVKLCRHV